MVKHMRGRFINVIYEDKDLLVANKPRGLIVAKDKEDPKTKHCFADEVRNYLMRKFQSSGGAFVKAVHRLDKETTGLVIFAKSKRGLGLVEDIKNHKVKRIYVAIVEGKIEDEQGTIKYNLIKKDFGHGKKVGVSKDGKPAITRYRVKERYENATMVEAELETGFTHQIRVHFAAMNFPLIGDKIYNPHGKIKFIRQALHAEQIKFTHPVNRGKIHLKAPLPKDMVDLIDSLRD